jgi:hypothetical protein
MTIYDRNKSRSALHHVLIQANYIPRNIRRSFTMEKMETMGKRCRAETTYEQQVLTNPSNFSSTQTQQQLQYPPAPAIDHIKEQEFWNHVVERTEQ